MRKTSLSNRLVPADEEWLPQIALDPIAAMPDDLVAISKYLGLIFLGCRLSGETEAYVLGMPDIALTCIAPRRDCSTYAS